MLTITQLAKQFDISKTTIIAILQAPSLQNPALLTKERWGEVMSAAGMSESDMANRHKQFEGMEPLIITIII